MIGRDGELDLSELTFDEKMEIARSQKLQSTLDLQNGSILLAGFTMIVITVAFAACLCSPQTELSSLSHGSRSSVHFLEGVGNVRALSFFANEKQWSSYTSVMLKTSIKNGDIYIFGCRFS